MKPWYVLNKKTGPVAAAGGEQTSNEYELMIYGDIGDSWSSESITAAQFVRDLQAIGSVDKIDTRINSLGGSVPDGLAIYNALKRTGARIVVTIDGMAMSIASLIAMAGDELQMAANALLMIHAPWMNSSGNSKELRDSADYLDVWAQGMATSYAAKTGKPVEDCLALLMDGQDHFFTAAEALAEGWIDSIVEAKPVAAHAALRVMAEARFHLLPAAAAANETTKENSMPGQNNQAAAGTPAAANNTDQIRAQALADDQVRRTEIAASGQPFLAHAGMPELVAKLQNDVSVSAAAANLQILAHLGQGTEPAAGGVVTVEDTGRDKRLADAADSILVRAGVATQEVKNKVRAERNPFMAYTMLDMCKASLEAGGVNIRAMDKMQVVGAAFTQTGSDFPILLENVLHKSLQEGYAVQADTWTRFCKRGSVTDFRDHPRYRVGSLGNLDPLNEAGEFTTKIIPDGEKASISADTKGNIITISRKIIVDDDLQAFVGIANMLGRSAKRTVEADVYALLAMNGGLGPVMKDGKTLFHADHHNIGSGAALSVDALDAERVLMGMQKDIGEHDFLDLSPAVLLVAKGMGGAARVIIGAEYDPDTANKLQRPNKVRGLVSDIVDSARLTGTRRYLFADPQTAPVIEVVFLDGNDMPFLDVHEAFKNDGVSFKARLDFGVGATDHRGAVTDKGAA
jgi:ATP-dependent protease ClpP protease subunit